MLVLDIDTLGPIWKARVLQFQSQRIRVGPSRFLITTVSSFQQQPFHSPLPKDSGLYYSDLSDSQ